MFIYTIMSLQMRLLRLLPYKVKNYPLGLETLGGHVPPCLLELWPDVLQLHRMIIHKILFFFFAWRPIKPCCNLSV